ncbi:MAG: GumC family protein [Rhodoblastus sp.]|uniref:GumC family protein n=1 Tax=Rhodoblastus sp. TaxID=1962975 RepID=UPI003F9BB47A
MGAEQMQFRADVRDEVDLDGLVAALGRNKRLIAWATLGAAAAALLFCFLVKPRYLAESRILIENQENYFTRADTDGSRMADAPALLDAEEVNSQIQLLKSRDLARKAIQALGLKGDPEFDPAASGGNFLEQTLSILGYGSSDQAQEDRLLIGFDDHLSVMSPAKTRVLQVEFASRDPDLAAKGANVVADLYIELKTQAKRDNAFRAARTLKPMIAALEARVAETDARVEDFRAKNGLFENGQSATVPTQQLGEIAAKLAEARAAQSEAQAKAQGLRELLQQGRLGDAAEIWSNDLVRRAAEQRMLVRAQLASESRTLLPAHPRIKELTAQIAELDSLLNSAVEKAAGGLENDARVAAARVANLSGLLEEQKHAVSESSADETRLRELQRDEKVLKDQLASEAAKYQAALARAEADSAPPDARIISRALAPSQPVFPKKAPITIFAALAGLFFAVGGLAANEMTRQRKADAPWKPPLPLELGEIKAHEAAPEVFVPAAEPAPPEETLPSQPSNRAVTETVPVVAPVAARPDLREVPEDEAQASSLGLIERIALAAGQGGVKVLIVSAEDCALARPSLRLARALAREGRAMLVQLDDEDAFLRAALEQAIGPRNAGEWRPGLAQLLDGQASFAEAIFRDAASRLHIVQAGGAVETEDGALDLILDALQATYDFVLIAGDGRMAATSLAVQAEMTVIFADDARIREFLHDDFAEAGAQEIVLAALDPRGEAVELAA